MELCNFSSEETQQINRAIRFIGTREVDLRPLLARTLIVNTQHFADECKQVSGLYPELGLEDGAARLVFNTTQEGNHKILVNQEVTAKRSFIHALASQLVHLGNLHRFNAEHGNIYRLSADQAIADYYYEFLLWTRFLAMKIATRAHALVSWHAVNGEAPPADGRYQFAHVGFAVAPLNAALEQLADATEVVAWREAFWEFLEELMGYFGQLAFYQNTANPGELDEHFPAERIEREIGLENCLLFYAALQTASDYPAWKEMRANLRRSVVAMQEHGKQRFSD